MSAGDHLNGNQFRSVWPEGSQLPMFATPSELADIQSNDYTARSVGQASKLLEPKDKKQIRDAVESSGGIERPVIVGHVSHLGYLIEGHHRAAVAIATNRLTPIEHHEGLAPAINSGYKQRARQYSEGWR